MAQLRLWLSGGPFRGSNCGSELRSGDWSTKKGQEALPWPPVFCPHLGGVWGEGGHTHRPAPHRSVAWNLNMKAAVVSAT